MSSGICSQSADMCRPLQTSTSDMLALQAARMAMLQGQGANQQVRKGREALIKG